MRKKKFISQEYSASGQGKNLKEGTPKSRTASIFIGSFFSFSVFIAIGLISFTIIFFFSQVDGSSMMTTLNGSVATNGGISTDSVIVNRQKTPKKGDIVVLKPFEDQSVQYIKRVIATGGDRMYFKENFDNTFTIFINDEELDESYLDKEHWGQNKINSDYRIVFNAIGNGVSNYTRNSAINTMQLYADRFNNWVPEFVQKNVRSGLNEIYVPDGYFFYVGDNRGGNGIDNTQDYRLMSKNDGMYRGPQPTWKIVGTVVDIMDHRSAPKWVWEKLGWFFTFKWAR